MTDRQTVTARARDAQPWTNTFPQKLSAIEFLIHGFFAVLSLFILSISITSLLSATPSWSLIIANVLGALGIGTIGLMTLRISTLEGAGRNSTRRAVPGRFIIRTCFFTEPLVFLAFALLSLGLGCMVFWIWDPYSYLPWGSGSKQSLMPLIFAGAVLCFVGLMAARPWRRRLVFTPVALEYRRFGKPISIPWDAIDSLTPEDEGFAKTVLVRTRPPGQPPTLARKRFPDGTAQGKLAIHSMSVDPGTIYYALNRLWQEPESRRLLETAEGVEQLFTGPRWRERIRMKPGQIWTPLAQQA